MINKNYAILFIAIIAFVLLLDRCSKVESLSEKDNVISVLNSEMKTMVDKNGVETAKNNSLSISYKELKKLRLKDSSALAELQKIVDRKTKSAIVTKNHTSGSVTGVTSIAIIDTIPSVCDSIFPTYESSIKDQWSDFKIKANKDSIHLDYTIKNEFQFKQKDEKQGKWPFRKNTPIVEVKSLNPHTRTDEIASYAVSVPKPKRIAWFGAGAATTAIIITVVKTLISK